jgi:hypothetical protein
MIGDDDDDIVVDIRTATTKHITDEENQDD